MVRGRGMGDWKGSGVVMGSLGVTECLIGVAVFRSFECMCRFHSGGDISMCRS